MSDIKETGTNEQHEAFAQDVAVIMKGLFEHNCKLLEGGFNPTPLVLALGLSSADLAASMAADCDNGEGGRAAFESMLDSLILDIRSRANEAYSHYLNVIAKRRDEAVVAAAGLVKP